jgi:SAM-dependent methyltransferase
MALSDNYAYLLSYVRGLPASESLKVLEYGCGGGEVVHLLREHGIDAVGCDIFYEGSETRHAAARAQEFITAIDDDTPLPYPDRSFDLIIANQVFEHIDDFTPVLERLRRVLRDDGQMLLHFPSAEVLREAHIGLPFVHWLPRRSRIRYLYTLGLRSAGLGFFKEGRTRREWTRAQLDWIDRYCFYKPYRQIRAAIDPLFTVSHHELPYIRFRAAESAMVRALLKVPATERLLVRLFRRVAFLALVLRKRSAAGGVRNES